MQARDNPFATDRAEKLLSFRPEWAGVSWNELDTAWKEANYRGVLTGRHGAGKTTLIEAWKKRLTEDGNELFQLFLNKESQQLNLDQWHVLEGDELEKKIVILDGEEQLGYLQRRRFYQLTQKAKGLIVTRHRQNHLPTLAHLEPSIEILHQCIKELAPEHYEKLEQLLEPWWVEKKGNIREILLECYDEL